MSILLGESKAKGPINIALIKYWGKSDEELILPINNSLSVTLDMNSMYSMTHVKLFAEEEQRSDNDSFEIKVILKINNEDYKVNKRQVQIITELSNSFLKEIKYKNLIFDIDSKNTFPTAAGCASSASGGACLVTALKGLLINVLSNLKSSLSDNLINLELSSLARRMSGSASRSVYSGFVEWETSGIARCIKDNEHWPEFRIMLLIVSNKQKDYSSTDGMKVSKDTSEFLEYRAKSQVEPRLIKIKQAIDEKNISQVCEIAMKDSNSFHAVCRDTFPPITYMNETSDFLVKCVNVLNNQYSKDLNIICGYSFDAGPNCFIFTTVDKLDYIKNFFDVLFKNAEISLFLKKIEEDKIRVDSDLVKRLFEEKETKQLRIDDLISFIPGVGSHLID